MEDVLAVYTRPRDPDCPLVCLDETSILPSLSFPPLEFCRGTRPSHAAKSRPERNMEGSGTCAARAALISPPTPGTPEPQRSPLPGRDFLVDRRQMRVHRRRADLSATSI
jgi:hypothetical protein